MIRKILKYLTSIILIMILCSCDFGYKKENGKIFYKYWNSGMGVETRTFEIKEADYKTFEKIEFDCNCDFNFAKDKNSVFIDGYKYNNVDPKTFKFLGNYIFADKDSVYFFGFYNNFNDCSIKGINAKKIQLLKYPWSKAGNILINGKDTLTLNDIESFQIIDENWGKTNSKIINKNRILKNADLKSFQILNDYQGKDKNNFYQFGEIKE